MPPKSKTTQALKAMKNLGYSEKSVRPVVNELLRLYEDNWMLIEDDGYRVLVEEILNSEEQKAHVNELKRPNALFLRDEDEENEPLNKKIKHGTLKKQASPSAQKNIPAKIYQLKKKTNTSSSQSLLVYEQETEDKSISADENNEFSTLKTFADMGCFEDEYTLHLSSPGTGNPSEYEPLPVDLANFQVPPLAVIPPDSPALILQGSSHENCCIAKESFPTYPEVINLDSEDECTADDLHPKDCDLEANYSEQVKCKDPEAEKVKHNPRDSLKLDIASSSRGDAKIFLAINAPMGPGFHVPTLEAMLKMVKEHCLTSYKIPPGFSLLELMKEVCECFLEAGTTSNLKPANEICISKKSNSEIITASTVLNDPVISFQNSFEFSLRIPRIFASIDLDLIWRRISLNEDVTGSVNMLKKGEPSSGLKIAIFIKKQRPYHFIKDITKGHESHEISLINEVNGDEGPTFHYILKNVTYRNANLSFPLARVTKEDCCSDCVGDCLSMEIPCNCAGKTGFQFAYSSEGLVKESFLDSFVAKSRSLPPHDLFYCQDCPFGKCNGHVHREFIKECWHKCGCGMKCGNRVVERGITAKLQVFMTAEGKGWGLRTLEDVPRGAFICEYVGEVVTIKELFERSKEYIGKNETYFVVLDDNWSSKDILKDDEALCLDATAYGNIARFINHRCFDGNLVGIPVEVESPERHYYHVLKIIARDNYETPPHLYSFNISPIFGNDIKALKLAFFTTREVNALEELTWDYGIEFGDNLSMKNLQCRCGSKFCRDHRSVKS